MEVNQVEIDVGTEKNKFNDPVKLRLNFIRKVLGIVSFQMLITTIMCLISMNSKSFAQFQAEKTGVFILFFILELACCIALVCSKKMSKTVPYNYCNLNSDKI